jgi:hypothetical protein
MVELVKKSYSTMDQQSAFSLREVHSACDQDFYFCWVLVNAQQVVEKLEERRGGGM